MAETASVSVEQQPISRRKLLLVEGENERRFFGALLRCLDLSEEVQLLNYGGKPQLRPLLSTLHLAPGFSDLTSLGVTRDADLAFASAFASIRSSLDNSRLDAPNEPLVQTGGKPSVSVFVLPDCNSPGMLETLCLDAVANDPAMPCVDAYLECLEDTAKLPPRNPSKARAHAFLASRERADLRVGEAAEAGHWRLDSPVFEPLKRFLQAL